MKLALEKFEK